MRVSTLFVSQRKLRDVAQIPTMIETLRDGGTLPPITLARDEYGVVQVEDGHHRLIAMWLAGQTELEAHQYLLVEKDQWRPRFGNVADLATRCGIQS